MIRRWLLGSTMILIVATIYLPLNVWASLLTFDFSSEGLETGQYDSSSGEPIQQVDIWHATGGGHLKLGSFDCDYYVSFAEPTYVNSLNMNGLPWEGYPSDPRMVIDLIAIEAFDINGNSLFYTIVDLSNYDTWNDWLTVTIETDNVVTIVFYQTGLDKSPFDGAGFWPSIDDIVVNEVAPVPEPATIDIHPDTVNLKSKGQWVTCYIELSEGFDVALIDIGTITLTIETSSISAESSPTEVEDYDNDGILDLMVKFDRGLLQDAVSPGAMELIVRGSLVDETEFEGVDAVLVIDKGKEHTNDEDTGSVVY